MYCSHYGFSERPFEVTPDPKFLYLSPSHREVHSTLLYGIREQRGFIVVLGWYSLHLLKRGVGIKS